MVLNDLAVLDYHVTERCIHLADLSSLARYTRTIQVSV